MLLKERHQNDAVLNNNRNEDFKKANSEKNANSKKKMILIQLILKLNKGD